MAARPKKSPPALPQKRRYVSQSDVPSFALTQALRVPRSICDNFGLQPTRPLLVAQGMGVQPTSGSFRLLCGSSIAYGLTTGGYSADLISLTPLGRRTVAPQAEGDDALACREAMLRPRIIREFLQKYDGAKLPREDIAHNVLIDMGVARDGVKKTLTLILEGARGVGFLRDVNGVIYVDLQGTPASTIADEADDQPGELVIEEEPNGSDSVEVLPSVRPVDAAIRKPRVFISHGKNMEIVAQVKTMLNVAEVEYEIAVEEETPAIPVPDKVFDAMRRCSAGIICVSPDAATDGKIGAVNQNVLIEIGAAFVLYDRRVILLWDKRVDVPSNLQGLYRCSFQGNELSWSDGMKLMEAIKKFRGSETQ